MRQGTNRTVSDEIAHVADPTPRSASPSLERPTARNQFSRIDSLPPRGLPQSTEVSARMADSWRSRVFVDKQEVGDARGQVRTLPTLRMED